MYTNGLTDSSSVEITTRDSVARFVFGIYQYITYICTVS